MYYQLFVFSKLNRFKAGDRQEKEECLPVSVIICARNEEKNLESFLPAVLNQNYKNFEVVVVNDCSNDDSEWLLKNLSEQYSHLKVVNIKEHIRYKHGKKFAVTIGIKAAAHNHLVFTDADCIPASPYWLQHMVDAFQPGIEIVLGYSPYFKYRGFLNAYIRFETFQTANNYLSYAIKGNPYMGVGRNLGYTKELFFKGKGFASHMHIASGDDDLFVNQNSTRYNTAVCMDPDAHMWSEPKRTWKSYFTQKIRHHSASKAYKGAHKRMLSLQIITAVLFYILLALCLLIFPLYWEGFVLLYLTRLLVQLLVYQKSMKALSVLDLLVYLPILDFAYYFYTSFNGIFSIFNRKVVWK